MDLKMCIKPKILLTNQGEPRLLFDAKENSDITELYFKKNTINGIVMVSETGTVYRVAVDVVNEDYINKRFNLLESDIINLHEKEYDEFMSSYMLEEVNKIRSIRKEE